MAIRVLDVVNFSNAKNPRADSGLQLQKELITAVLRKRPDFFFYLLAPNEIAGDLQQVFSGQNVQVLSSSLLSRQQGGAFHFDARELSKLLNLNQIDIDLLFVNQPEQTCAFLDYFNKHHFLDVHSFTYVHWMDWKRQDNTKNRWNVPSNLSILSSILVSAVTGCNSQFGRNEIVREAKKWLNKENVSVVESKLVPLYPGINSRELVRAKGGSPISDARRSAIKTIVFPYRTQKYTGFKSLVEVHLASLWRKRRDFCLLLTNPSDYDLVKTYPKRFPFIKVRQFDREQYLAALWEADIVVGCHTGANQWSLAVVEAIAAECVPLLNKEAFFDELLLSPIGNRAETSGFDRYFYYRQTFSEKLEYFLNNLATEKRHMKKLSAAVRRFYDWSNRVDDWIRCFEIAQTSSCSIRAHTPTLRKIESLINDNGQCRKSTILRSLRWHPKSRQIPWTRYRNSILTRFEEDASCPDVLFKTIRQSRSGSIA